MMQRISHLFVFSAALWMWGSLIAQNTYLGPTEPVVGDPHLVRVQVLVRDSPEPAGVQILSATFDGQEVPLKPRDLYGNRGGASFQVAPGKYTLRWVVNRDRFTWPRRATHEEAVNISPRDQWIQISIEGEAAAIR